MLHVRLATLDICDPRETIVLEMPVLVHRRSPGTCTQSDLHRLFLLLAILLSSLVLSHLRTNHQRILALP